MTLILSGGAFEAQAQVFLLQGEPGPPGKTVLTATRASDPLECPFSGVTIERGVDDDGDNVLDPDEVEGVDVRCENAITTPRTITVTDQASLRAALQSLQSVSLQALVTIALPPTITLTEITTISHRDSRFLSINGAPTTVTTGLSEGFRVLTGGIVFRDLTVERSGNAGGTGINIAGVGSDATLINVTVSGFNDGIAVVSGSATLVDVAVLNNRLRGLRVEAGGRVRNQNTFTSRGNDTALLVSQSASATLDDATLESVRIGASVIDGGVLAISNATVAGNISIRGGHVNIDDASIDGVFAIDGGAGVISNTESVTPLIVSQNGALRVLFTTGRTPIELTARAGGVITFDADHRCTESALGQCLQIQE
jgi:hypothetical protein